MCVIFYLFTHVDSTEDKLVPTYVSGLAGVKVVQVCCGSGDAHTVALDSSGNVWTWGDGEFGKLGRGGSEASRVPKMITSWGSSMTVKISKIACGSQLTIALSTDGQVYTWSVGVQSAQLY